MPNNREEIELAFKIEMETRKALGEVSKIDKSLKAMVNHSLQIKDFDSKSIKDFRKEAGKTAKDLNDIAKSMSPNNRKRLDAEFKSVEKAYKKLCTVTRVERTKIAKIEQKLSKATSKDEKSSAKAELDLAKKTTQALIRQARFKYAGKRKELGTRMVATGGTKNLEKNAASKKQTQEFVQGIKDTKVGREIAGSFSDALGALRGKDIFGLGKAGYRLSAGMLKGAAKASIAHGAGIAAKGEAKGGMMGGAMKGLGKAMQGIGPLMGTLSKLVPILGLVGGAVMGLVKLFLDVDAAVKEMNKTVLEGASTWDIYASQGKDVGLGMSHLDDILGKVRKQTTDFTMNAKMGTTAKDHQQFINVLSREGISLQHIDATLEENKKNVDATNKSMKQYTDISSMAIGYSRLFGVSLDEIAQFQSELMRDLGDSLSDVALEFDKIGNAADAAGMAQNKFFAILRGVSSDMGLYGVRVEEVTKMLGQLGKVMSPRSAEKYMKTFAQGMKGTSVQDRLKTMLLGGPKAIKDVQQDIAKQTDDMVKKFQDTAGIKDAGTAKAILAGKTVGGVNLKGLEKAGKLGGAKSSDLQEQFQDLAMSGEQAKHGAYGAAMAAENVTGYGAMKAKREGMGGKSFLSAFKSGDVREHQVGVLKAGGEENLKAYAHMEMAINQQKEAVVDALENPASNPELIKYLKKIGKYDEKNTKEAKEANKKAAEGLSGDELWASLDEKNAAATQTDAEKMLQMGKEQGTRTQSMLEMLGAIFDALFNQIYGILMDIADTFNTKFGTKSAIREQALGSKNSEVVGAWGRSGGDVGKYMGALAGSNTAKGIDALLHSTDDKDIGAKNTQKSQIAGAFEGDSLTGKIADDLASALKESGIGGSDAERILSAQKSGKSVGASISAGGLSDKAEADLYSKMALWFTGATGRTMIMDQAGGKSKGGVPTTPEVPAQQQATAAAANPGQGGGAAVVAAAPQPPAAATAPGAGPAGTPGAAIMSGPNKIPTLPDEKQMNDAVLDQVDFTGAAVVNSLQDLWNALRMKGIKFDRTQLEGLYQNVIHKGTYLGAQDALAEYALYTATDPSGVLKRMKDSGFEGVGKLADTLGDQMENAKNERAAGHAAGGLVTGINGGMAQISPAPGEGLASIGRGERILPAGAGGGASVALSVNGIGGADLGNFLRVEVGKLITEYKRREKFT
jgi:hypothetical protein